MGRIAQGVRAPTGAWIETSETAAKRFLMTNVRAPAGRVD